MESKLEKFLPKKSQWLIILLVGILLVVIAIPTDTESGTGTFGTYDETEISTTDMERRLENLLGQMQGVGEVHTMITYQEDESVEGIVVIAEGGGNAVVVRNITEVVQALFAVDSHKIKVIEKNQNN